MKNYLYIFLIGLLALLPVFTGCSGDGDQHAENMQPGEYYTCPMHPTVRSDRPGACPVCNMTLVKASSIAQDTAPNTIQIVKEQQPLANIRVDTVKMGSINDGLILLGTTSYNENERSVITARAKGRIEKLVKRNPGETVNKGELLYILYSEELSAAEQEYITALMQKEKYPDQDKAVEALLQAARTRLLLSGLSEAQIKELEKKKQMHSSIPFYSEASGVITEIPVKEGEYVEIGNMIYSLTNLGTLWVDAQLYSNELSALNHALPQVEINGVNYKASIELVTPALEDNSRINMVKFRIDNKNLNLKPGMMASVQLKGKDRKALVIPKTALVLGKMPMVWVQIGPELFESRMVKTGIETKKDVEIIEGLKEGDLILISGAYLVNSEFILKKGATAQHQHAH
jgi:membrane fusion protein, copper/silver efflux system